MGQLKETLENHGYSLRERANVKRFGQTLEAKVTN